MTVYASIGSHRRTHGESAQINETNPILDVARDSWDDNWGDALSWGFAMCSTIAYLGDWVSPSAGYRSSVAGPANDLADGSYENAITVEVLGLGTIEYDEATGQPSVELYDNLSPQEIDRALAIARHAWAVLERILDLTPEEDRY